MRMGVVASTLVLGAFVASCGGGGGGTTTPAVVATAVAPGNAVPAAPASASVSVTPGGSADFPSTAAGFTGKITLPPMSGGSSGAVAAALQDALPANVPQPQSAGRAPARIGGSIDPLVYVTLLAPTTITLNGYPAFTFTVPPGRVPAGDGLFVGLYDPSAGTWQTIVGPLTVNGRTVTVPASTAPITLAAGTTYVFVLFAAPLPTPVPSPTPSATPPQPPPPTPTPTPSPTAPATSGVVIIR